MKDVAGVILAAGEGTRMNSSLPKVLHKICGKPMLQYMFDNLKQLRIERNVVVIGHRAKKVKEFLGPKIKVVRQAKLLGSADAVWHTRSLFSNFKGDVLVVYGDTPLVTYQSLRRLVTSHQKNRATCTVLTTFLKNPTGFGRITRSKNNRILRIVEEQDADTYEKAITEINVGAYCFKAKDLFLALKQIKPDNVKKEYYLTDIIEVFNKRGRKIESVSAQNEGEAQGVNSRRDLAHAWAIINKRNIESLIVSGVTILDPATTYLYGEIKIGRDTVIYPHTIIEGKVEIGCNCQIGPFARIKSGSVLENGAQIGNFVEIVRSRIGLGSKVKHHSYIGDTTVGKGVNVGAGTIVANYDGKNKNPTFIDDGSFIGTGTILIAPVKIGKKVVTGAGSVVTKNKDVPDGATVVGVPARILKTKKR